MIGVVAFLVFGPERLPEAARAAGRLLGRIRQETRRNVADLQGMTEVQQLRNELRGLRSDLDEAGVDLRRQIDTAAEEPTAPGRGGTGERPRRRAAPARRPSGSGPGHRADDDPPPTDPEAT